MSFTPTPDPFLNHPDNANLPTVNKPATLIATTVTFLILAFIAISLRLWVRVKDSLWGWDDAFVFLAGAASIGGDIIVCLMPADGQGRHLWTLSSDNLMSYFRHVYSTNIAYCLSSTFIKLSILFQYLRLYAETMPPSQGRSHQIARLTTIILIVLVTLWGAAFSLLAVFSCDPIAKNWNPFMKGRCVGWGSKEPTEFFAMFVGHSASNMTLDIIVLLAPVPFLRMLRLAGKSKVGLVTLFILGCTVTSLAIGRMISLSINRAGTIPVLDMSFHTPIIYIFSVLEVNIAIIAASIPIFWPVIAEYATNKIWVVNEIEIHVEEGGRDSFSSSGGIDLTKTTSWKQDKKEDFEPQTISVIGKTYDRSASRQNEHRHKMSNTSSLGRTVGRELGTRSSQESQRALYRAGSNDSIGKHVGVVRSEHDEWLGTLGRKMSVGHSTTIVEKALPTIPGQKWQL